MRIVQARRISQIFFLLLFFWFCWVTTLGEQWWQLRGWPVNLFIQLDPLVGLATLLATRTLYAGLIWGAATVALTLVLGRFFCGWLCPFGTLQQAAGYLVHRRRRFTEKIHANRYREAHRIKYVVLTVLLAAAGADLLPHLVRLPGTRPLTAAALFAAALALGAVLRVSRLVQRLRTGLLWGGLLAGFFGAGLVPATSEWIHAASVQTGLLDPIPLAHRSVNLALLPLIRGQLVALSDWPRYYQGAWAMAVLFWGSLLACLWIPRFYCRIVCPLGALFGALSRSALWRIAKEKERCRSCPRCESWCEGACSPSGEIRLAECTLCMNCMEGCREGTVGFRTRSSATGEIPAPDLSRRAFAAALVSGLVAVPTMRLSGTGSWPAARVRPPGATDEDTFLRRCIKCGQCMRVCPTNVIQPAGLQAGLEGLWTPVLDFRIGTSGCQLHCIACGHGCPTAAIRPLFLDEKLGRGRWADRGPIRIGTAFVDRGRCLPWAMERPCIVCQENCPVSPKAITTQRVLRDIVGLSVQASGPTFVEARRVGPIPGGLLSGDYFLLHGDEPPRRIVGADGQRFDVSPDRPWHSPPGPDSVVRIAVALQQPYVDPARCIGCGICEHECPVRGLRAIRVTADNETRTASHALVVGLSPPPR